MLYLIGISILSLVFVLKESDTNDSSGEYVMGLNKYSKNDELFKKYAKIYSIPWQFVKAIAYVESRIGLDPLTIAGLASSDGLSYGIMQIAEGVGSTKEKEIKGYKGAYYLNDNEYSIDIGSKLISYLYVKYNKDLNKVALAYNQGEKNTDNGKNYTAQYDVKVLTAYEKIKKGEI